MARPRKCRRVCGMPRTNSFAPMGSQLCEERIIMAVDEYETIRLIDLAGYTQEECAAPLSHFAAIAGSMGSLQTTGILCFAAIASIWLSPKI